MARSAGTRRKGRRVYLAIARGLRLLVSDAVPGGAACNEGIRRAGRPSEQAGSVLAAGHFQQVITELGLYRALHHVDRGAEYYGVEFLDHLAWAERAEVTAAAAGWAAGVVFGDLGEIGTAFDCGFQFVALVFAGNQDVTGSGAC